MRPDPSRVAELFDALADLSPDEAQRRLAAECAGQDELRAAVERLLAHDRQAAGALFEPDPRLLAGALEGLRARAAPAGPTGDGPEVSAKIGRFTVVRKLGEGATGVVYLGYDEVLDRRMALKLLRPHATGASWLVREGQALGRLAHPNVVAVHDVGEHGGQVYLAMEFVEGRTLRAYLDEEERPFRALLDAFVGAGRGLAAVHDAGLVHRDFKPENVLIGRDGRPRVVDFGAAGLASADDAAGSRGAGGGAGERSAPVALEATLVRAGTLIGTPAYMAPEQLRGERATAASDQWGYCVALYRAAYKRPPFALDGPLSALARRVLDGEPEPPPRLAGVPAWLGPILLRGLAKEPAARFPSMHALLAAIERHVPRDPELDRSLVRGELLRQRGALFVAAAVLATTLGPEVLHPERGLKRLTLLSVLILGMASLVVTLRWKKLSQNRYGRRSAALFIGVTAATLVHRLIAMRLGTPVAHVLVDDMVVHATFFGTTAVVMDRRLAVPAAISVSGAVLGAFAPGVAWLAFAATALLTLTLLVWLALR